MRSCSSTRAWNSSRDSCTAMRANSRWSNTGKATASSSTSRAGCAFARSGNGSRHGGFSMKTTLAMLVAVMLASAATGPVAAHHSFAAEFDAKQPVLFKGTVTKMEWINPHVWIHMNVTQPNGKTEAWMVEGGAPTVLFRRGFSKTSLQAGTQIVVDGYRAKDGTNKMTAREITFGDGRKLFAGSEGTGAPR